MADPVSGTTLYTSDWAGDRLMLGGMDNGGRIYVWASFDGRLLDIRRLPDLTPVSEQPRALRLEHAELRHQQ